MGLLDHIRGSQGSRSRVSPQGWDDKSHGWPEGSVPGSPPAWATPADAAQSLEEALEGLHGLAIEGFPRGATEPLLTSVTNALDVLLLPVKEIPIRKGTMGRVVHALLHSLPVMPWLARRAPLHGTLVALASRLAASSDPELAREGQRLERIMADGQVHLAWLLGASSPGVEEPGALDSRPAAQSEPGPRAKPGRVNLPSLSEPDLVADLTREKIYRCLLEECIKDGHLSSTEETAILSLRRLLGIPVHQHARMVREVQSARADGRLQGAAEMQSGEFYSKLFRIALEDGVVTPDEARLLRSVADHLGLGDEERQRAEALARSP